MKKQVRDYYASMEEGSTFHVYNRTIDKALLFKDEEDRITFMDKYKEYIHPYVNTYAYCLLGNHFHFLVSVKSLELIEAVIQKIPKYAQTVTQKKLLEKDKKERQTNKLMYMQFSRLFTSYVDYYKKKYPRPGGLFVRRFKRVEVDSDVYFSRLIYYIHKNPYKHGLVKDFKKYHWSSYRTYLSNHPTLIKRTTILNWFGGLEAFINFHNSEQNLDDMKDLLFDD